jgi:AAA ATPase domain
MTQLLDGIRGGRSFTLVIRGEPGIGKSALLDYVAERSPDCRVARVAGVESEMALAYAGLAQLFAGPMLERAEQLPAPQQDALRRALDLKDGPAPANFLVGLAALSLLSYVADEQPLVCVIDDVQWLDPESLSVLSFVARRLAAEPIGMLFAVREPNAPQELDELPELRLEGLAAYDARLLLDTVLPGGLDQQIRDRIVAETRGNPLALLELPRGLTPAELAGGFGLPEARALPSRIEQSFLRRVQSLPPETRRVLLVAAAEAAGDAAVLRRAAERLELDTAALSRAEDEGLIELGPVVRFRHPLVRSASYQAATAEERRQAHQALAAATDPEHDPDRRAWHRARATAGPDESAAGDLERLAARAQTRGGVAAAAAFLERATELSVEPARRGTRALAAAQLKFEAGAPDPAERMLSIARASPLDELERAHAERLGAQIAYARTRGSDTPLLLSAAAKRLEPLDLELARETHLEALWAAVRSGRFVKVDGVVEAAQAATRRAGHEPARAIDLLFDAVLGRPPALPRGVRAHGAADPRGGGDYRRDPERPARRLLGAARRVARRPGENRCAPSGHDRGRHATRRRIRGRGRRVGDGGVAQRPRRIRLGGCCGRESL